uniref:TIL domain-containing protein n=1 Tax=Acrobeloides nanus TaxID=290746 RepID=A0A914EJA4_9BILA
MYKILVAILSAAALIDAEACAPNEEWLECSSACEFTCDDYLNRGCTEDCHPPKCQCIYGYVRNSNGKTCPLNEEWRQCSSCEGTCDNPNPICTLECRSPKCQCKYGYVRNHSTGKCVLANSNQC